MPYDQERYNSLFLQIYTRVPETQLMPDSSIRLVAVDAEELLATMTREGLRAEGVSVWESPASCSQLHRLIEQVRPDILLVDEQLEAGSSGIETVRRLRGMTEVPIVLATTNLAPDHLERAAAAGASCHLAKPAGSEDLRACLKAALVSRRALQPAPDLTCALPQEALEALHAHVAVIDQQGMILASNAKWKQLCCGAGQVPRVTDVGRSFLGVLAGEGQPETRWPSDIRDAVDQVSREQTDSRDVEFSLDDEYERGIMRRFHVARISGAWPPQLLISIANLSPDRNKDSELRMEGKILESIARSPSVGMFRSNRDGLCEYLSPKGCELTGLTSESARGLGWLQRLHACCKEEVAERWQEAVRSRLPFQAEYRFILPDGGTTWLFGQATPFFDDDGSLSGYTGTLTDISASKRAQQSTELISNELVKLGGTLFFETTLLRVAELLEVDVAIAFRSSGHAPEVPDCLAMVHDGVVVPPLPSLPRGAPRDRITAGHSALVECDAWGFYPDDPLLKRFKASFYCEQPIHATTGEVIGSLCVLSTRTLRDPHGVVTALRLFASVMGATMERQRAERRYADFFKDSTAGLVMVDQQARIVQLNKVAEFVFGWTLEELQGKPIEILVPDGLRLRHTSLRDDYLSLRAPIQPNFEARRVQGLRKDKTIIPLEIGLVTIGTGAERSVVATVRDISMEHALKKKLAVTQKMEAIGELAGGVAHDFNNLLTAINGFARILHKRLESGGREQGMVQEILRAGERAASLTQQLLTFGNRQATRPLLLDLNRIVREAAPMLFYLLGDNIKLAIDLDPGIGAIKSDPGNVEQIVINLALNARDAMLSGGSLTIRSSAVVLETLRAAELQLEAGVEYVLLAVSDTGVGIPADVLPHIFEPFYTTKGSSHGVGMGLAVVYGVVKQNQGALEVVSEEAQGTTFFVYLPKAGELTEIKPSPRRSQRSTRKAGQTLLVVEDEPTVRHLTREILEDAGYHVIAVSSGEDALKAIHNPALEFDGLLTDLALPGVSGREVAAIMEQRHPSAGIVLMSGYSKDELDKRALVMGGLRFIQKPFNQDELLELLDDCVRSQPVEEC